MCSDKWPLIYLKVQIMCLRANEQIECKSSESEVNWYIHDSFMFYVDKNIKLSRICVCDCSKELFYFVCCFFSLLGLIE